LRIAANAGSDNSPNRRRSPELGFDTQAQLAVEGIVATELQTLGTGIRGSGVHGVPAIGWSEGHGLACKH
jgi:hypothetical protein